MCSASKPNFIASDRPRFVRIGEKQARAYSPTKNSLWKIHWINSVETESPNSLLRILGGVWRGGRIGNRRRRNTPKSRRRGCVSGLSLADHAGWALGGVIACWEQTTSPNLRRRSQKPVGFMSMLAGHLVITAVLSSDGAIGSTRRCLLPTSALFLANTRSIFLHQILPAAK